MGGVNVWLVGRLCLTTIFRISNFRCFMDVDNVLVRNFPTKVFLLTALHHVLLKKNGAPGIRYKGAGSRQQDVASAVMHFNPAPQIGGVTSHHPSSIEAGKEVVNSTEVLSGYKVVETRWKTSRVERKLGARFSFFESKRARTQKSAPLHKALVFRQRLQYLHYAPEKAAASRPTPNES
jgi:hypothetical protein